MTKEEIIEMGMQAGISKPVLLLGNNLKLLTAFAKLVAEKEREECAKRLEAVGCQHCAENIRLKGFDAAYENYKRNETLEEVAQEIEKFKGFGEDTIASFTVYIRSMKK